MEIDFSYKERHGSDWKEWVESHCGFKLEDIVEQLEKVTKILKECYIIPKHSLKGQEDMSWLDNSIATLQTSMITGILTCCDDAGIHTLGELITLGKRRAMYIRNFGKKKIRAIERCLLEQYGYEWE